MEMPQLYRMALADLQGNVQSYGPDKAIHESEALKLHDLFNDYMDSELGDNFVRYVRDQGRELVDIKGTATENLGEHTVAAIYHNGLEGILLTNYSGKTFDERVDEMAEMYGIDNEAMSEYVITHELSHAAGNKSEYDCESFVADYFTERASLTVGEEHDKYVHLASIARIRADEAKEAGK
jgi:hypothetical protein